MKTEKQQRFQKPQAVATRGSHLGSGLSDGIVKTQTSVTCHEFTCDVPEVQLVYANYFDFDSPGPNPINVKASIEYPIGSGFRYEVFFHGGKREIEIAPGADVESRSIPLNAKAKTKCLVFSCATVPEGGKFPRGQVAYSNRGEGLKNGDIVDSGTPDTQGQYVYHPVAIIGRPKEPTPAVLIVGDSIASGAQDNPQDRGFIPLALGNEIPWIRISKGNESVYGFAGAACRFRMRLAKYCTHAIIHSGTNDFVQKNLAQYQNDLIALLQSLSDYGLKNFVCTIPPRTVSKTDMSPVNPAFALNGDVMKANAWLLSNPRPDLIAGIFDTSRVLRNPERLAEWDPVVLGGDGIHPGSAGHTRMAAQIDKSMIQI
ncbi:SGNH/GDSL hydrolase family protein [Paenibacillus oleatilyticus]|uniref:SGNH/GDSL hydrolase family protein n=1 Tax=Paenibacillus oleatilyticus TaxID=2594886 RepID=A0ABV4USZ5_9BACL